MFEIHLNVLVFLVNYWLMLLLKKLLKTLLMIVQINYLILLLINQHFSS